MTYSNAGHENPFLLRADASSERLETGGTVLGVVENFPFDEGTVSLGEGDILVIFSDGITEAFDTNDNQFGEERLARVIQTHRNEFAQSIMVARTGSPTSTSSGRGRATRPAASKFTRRPTQR